MKRGAIVCYAGALVTLPLVGVDLLSLVTGRDWGWGLQPSWFLLGMAYVLGLGDATGRGDLRASLRRMVGHGVPGWWRWGAVAVGAAVLLSAAGLKMASSGVDPASAWSRFGKQVVQLAIMVAFVIWPAVWTRGAERWERTLGWLTIGAGVQVIYGLLQVVGYYRPFRLLAWLEGFATSNPSILAGSRHLYLDGVMHQIPRLRGTMCEPLFLGNFLLLAIPLALVSPGSLRRRVGLAAVLLVLLFATWSRGAWLALGVAVLVSLVMAASRSATRGMARRVAAVLGVGAALVGALVVVGGLAGWETVRLPLERLGQTFNREDWSNLTRIYSMQAGWRAFTLNPVVGVGWGQFGFHFPALVDPLGLQSQFTWPVVNNFPLLILCETGLVGMSVFIFLVGRLVRGTFRAFGRISDDTGRLRVLALAAGCGGVWVQLLTFSQYNLPHIWVALGLLLAAVAEGEGESGTVRP